MSSAIFTYELIISVEVDRCDFIPAGEYILLMRAQTACPNREIMFAKS